MLCAYTEAKERKKDKEELSVKSGGSKRDGRHQGDERMEQKNALE